MAISKLILNGEVQMDVTSNTNVAGNMLSGIIGTKNDGTSVTGNIATKSSTNLTASGSVVTAPAGYYSTAATKSVAAGSAFPPAVTITKAPTFSINSSTGVVTASYSGSSSITPTITSGYISQGTAGTVSTTGTSTYQLPTQAAATINTSTANQTIASYRWLTGTQTIRSVTTSNLASSNIKSGVTVKVGDAGNSSRIAQITGTYAPSLISKTITPTSTTQIVTPIVSETTHYTRSCGYLDAGETATYSSISLTVGKTYYVDVQLVKNGTTYTASTSFSYSGAMNFCSVSIANGYVQINEDSAYLTNTYGTLSFTILSRVMADGLSQVTVEPSSYIATLTGSGQSTYCYVLYKDTKYYTNNTSFVFQAGETLTICAKGDTYDYTLPADNIKLKFSYTNATNNSIDIYPNFLPQFYSAYAIYATNSNLPYSNDNIIEWFNSLSQIRQYQFMGRQIQATASTVVNFSNVQLVSEAGFAQPFGAAYVYSFAYNFPICTSIGNYAFYQNQQFSTVSLPECLDMGIQAFYSCGYLSTIDMPKCLKVAHSAFYQCARLTTASFSSCTSIGQNAFYSCSKLTSISFPKCTIIQNNAFYNCLSLQSANFPSCTSIGNSAFYYCRSLSTISFPNCTYIGSSAFEFCQFITTASFPLCSYVGDCAFFACELTTASFPLCTSIGSSTFWGQSALSSIYFPICTYISSCAFEKCSSLTTINFPQCVTISTYAFESCVNLTTISFPLCETIGGSAFNGCNNLTTAFFPKCSIISSYAFYGCSNLTTASFPSCTSMGQNAFYGCTKLISLYLLGSSIVSLYNGATFSNTPLSKSTYTGTFGSIFVPASLYNSYCTTTIWTQYSARIVSV